MKDEKTKKIASKIFWKLFLALLVGFAAIYISEATGYYEFEQHNKKVLTEEKIKQFEEDVANGKNVDINSYVDKNEKNYESKISRIGSNVSKKVSDTVVGGLEATFNFLNKTIGG